MEDAAALTLHEDTAPDDNILVAGAGAIGCIVAAYLGRAGYRVTLTVTSEEDVEAVRSTGLRIDGHRGRVASQPVVCTHDQAGRAGQPFEVAFIAVKCPGTKEIIDQILPSWEGVSTIVSLQNGLMEQVLSGYTPGPVVGAVTNLSARRHGPGRVTETGTFAGFVVGELDGRATQRAQRVAALLDNAASTQVTDNIWGHLWAKLVLNAMVNAISGLTQMTIGDVVLHSDLRRVCLRIGYEAVQVVRAYGVEFPLAGMNLELFGSDRLEDQAAADAELRKAAKGSLKSLSSLAHDILLGRQTEIDFLNGAIVERGYAMGLTIPANEAIVGFIKTVERGTASPGKQWIPQIAQLAPDG